MGGGIAYQIATQYPNVLKEYQKFNNKRLGEVCFVETKQYVVLVKNQTLILTMML
jgi:O-acetyl-ADP-ribose deacetylase (regulator of RNase III)